MTTWWHGDIFQRKARNPHQLNDKMLNVLLKLKHDLTSNLAMTNSGST